MPTNPGFNKTFHALEKAISITQRRQNLIAGNISNLDTPGFRPKDIDFKQAMAKALESGRGSALTRTNPLHMDPVENGMPGSETFENGYNGVNWIDLDNEMRKLTENRLMYRTAVEILMRKIAILKEVIKEGGS